MRYSRRSRRLSGPSQLRACFCNGGGREIALRYFARDKPRPVCGNSRVEPIERTGYLTGHAYFGCQSCTSHTSSSLLVFRGNVATRRQGPDSENRHAYQTPQPSRDNKQNGESKQHCALAKVQATRTARWSRSSGSPISGLARLRRRQRQVRCRSTRLASTNSSRAGLTSTSRPHRRPKQQTRTGRARSRTRPLSRCRDRRSTAAPTRMAGLHDRVITVDCMKR